MHRPCTATGPANHNGGVTDRTPWQRRTRPLPEPHLARLQKRLARGESLEEAAEGVGLTLSLAKSVFIRSGLEIPKPLRRSTRSRALGKRVHAHLQRVDRASVSEVAAALGVSAAEVRRDVWPKDRDRLIEPRPGRERYSDAAILIGLQIMSVDRALQAQAVGRVAVSAAWWDAHRDPVAHPPSSVVRERFGSWAGACRQAGIPQRKQVRPTGPARRWTEAALLEVLREFFESAGESTSSAYQQWSAGRHDTPSLGTLVLRFGSWTRVRELAQG